MAHGDAAAAKREAGFSKPASGFVNQPQKPINFDLLLTKADF
jgi:hypothetical protein